MSRRPFIKRPVLNKSKAISDLEREITSKINRYVDLCGTHPEHGPNPRISFFMNNIMAGLRRRGLLLPGDGKGGFILPSQNAGAPSPHQRKGTESK